MGISILVGLCRLINSVAHLIRYHNVGERLSFYIFVERQESEL